MYVTFIFIKYIKLTIIKKHCSHELNVMYFTTYTLNIRLTHVCPSMHSLIPPPRWYYFHYCLSVYLSVS